jgi:ribosomal protein L11 methylase PrmA
MMIESKKILPCSFRDPAGFLFQHQGDLYRQINPAFVQEYQHLMQCGLYHTLCQEKLIIPHQQIDDKFDHTQNYLVIKPEKIAFVSYPYEWCFSQLKDAALLTLRIQKIALDYGMILKDASAYNVQFHQGQPIFIDTLSFTPYQEGTPWQGYQQFCQHFLAPLMLMRYRDIRLNQLLKIYIDGIPLDLASALLPFYTKFKLWPALHIHLHAKMQKKYQSSATAPKKHQKFNVKILKRMNESLLRIVNNLKWPIEKNSPWFDYYTDNNNYSADAMNEKEKIIGKWLQNIEPTMVWDLGANRGRFSRLAAQYCQQVMAFDIDTSCVESFYLDLRKDSSPILPLTLDLTNPSPSLGWSHHERQSLMERGPTDTILALGLIHHLAIGHNVPLAKLARFFSCLTNTLIIEFIPKEDSQIQKLLLLREDIFDNYTQTHFETSFSKDFHIIERIPIAHSQRMLYLFEI